MELYKLKFPYRKILLPLAKKLKNINPDTLSYLAVFVSFVTGLLFYFSKDNPLLLLWIIFLIFLRMTLNTLDGLIAIEQQKKDLFGEVVNALPDRYSDIFVMLGISLSGYCNTIIGTLATVSVLLVSYAGMLGKAIGVSWQHQGPLGKVERLIFIMLASFLQYLSIKFKVENICIFSYKTTILEVMMLWFIIGAQITIFNRTKSILKEIKEKIK